jgi:hypothetical protein
MSHILLTADCNVYTYFNMEHKLLEDWPKYSFLNTKKLWKQFNLARVLCGAQGQYGAKQFTYAPLKYVISWVHSL